MLIADMHSFYFWGLVGSLYMKQILSWITDNISAFIAKMAFSNGVLEKVLVLENILKIALLVPVA